MHINDRVDIYTYCDDGIDLRTKNRQNYGMQEIDEHERVCGEADEIDDRIFPREHAVVVKIRLILVEMGTTNH